jgi:hypothetical protein
MMEQTMAAWRGTNDGGVARNKIPFVKLSRRTNDGGVA